MRKSKLGFIQTHLPNDAEETYTQFRIAPHIVASVGRIERVFDQRPYRNYSKSYSIDYQQTLGGTLDKERMLELADIELQAFIESYSSQNAEVISQHIGSLKSRGYLGSEVHLTYDDSELGEQHVLARFSYSPQLKVTHRVSGDEIAIESDDTSLFFDSTFLVAGYFQKPGLLSEEWKSVDSPLDIFRVYLPKAQKPYVPIDFKVERKGSVERVSALFHDPVLDKDIFYTLYGYKVEKNFNPERVARALRQKHITPKQRGDDTDIAFQNIKVDGVDVVETEFAVKFNDNDQKGIVRLRAHYKDNYLMVHEVVGTQNTVRSSLIENIINSVVFYPGLDLDALKAVEAEMGSSETPAFENIGQ